MIRNLLQPALCFILCPLLAAQGRIADAQQQSAQSPAASAAVTTQVQPVVITTADGMSIELVALDSLSAANAVLGQAVRLAVVRDVLKNGVTAIRAGAPVTGIVTKVRYGCFKSNRGDELDVRLTDLAPGALVRLRLATISSSESTYPGEPMPAYPGYPVSNGPSPHAEPIFATIMCAVLFIAIGLTKH